MPFIGVLVTWIRVIFEVPVTKQHHDWQSAWIIILYLHEAMPYFQARSIKLSNSIRCSVLSMWKRYPIYTPIKSHCKITNIYIAREHMILREHLVYLTGHTEMLWQLSPLQFNFRRGYTDCFSESECAYGCIALRGASDDGAEKSLRNARTPETIQPQCTGKIPQQ
jgi:hypothetical protein